MDFHLLWGSLHRPLFTPPPPSVFILFGENNWIIVLPACLLNINNILPGHGLPPLEGGGRRVPRQGVRIILYLNPLGLLVPGYLRPVFVGVAVHVVHDLLPLRKVQELQDGLDHLDWVEAEVLVSDNQHLTWKVGF